MLLLAQRDKLKGRGSDPAFKALVALVIYIGITVPFVEWPGSVIRANFAEFVKAILFFFFTALIVDSEKRLRVFLWLFVGLQVFRVLEPLTYNLAWGYWGSATHLGHGEFAQRLAGAPTDIINPNELGFVIVTVIPFLHYILLPAGFKGKLLYLLLMPALLYALILTMSRGAFIALLVVAFMVFKESRHKFGLIILAVAIAIGGVSVMTPLQKDRYLSLVDEDTQGGASVQGRMTGMLTEFKLGLERPVVGHGVGTTPEAKTHILGKSQASHNLYAEILIELGIIGAVVFLRFIWKIYGRFSKNIQLLSSSNLRRGDYYERLNKAMIAVFWMYVVYSLNYWGLSQYYWYLFGGLAIAFGRLVEIRLNASDPDEMQGSKHYGTARFPLALRYRSPARHEI